MKLRLPNLWEVEFPSEPSRRRGPQFLWKHTPTPKGCICPPTSEKTCQRSDCGRKDVNLKIGGS